MAGSTSCKFVSIFLVVICVMTASARADLLLDHPELSHYTETTYLSDYDDVVVDSKVAADLVQLGPVRGYGGTVFEQDSRSTRYQIYNDNGISPMVGAKMLLPIPQFGVFTEYRQTFRMIERPDGRAPSQGDLLTVLYGYDYRDFARLRRGTSLFQEEYGNLVSRSKLQFDPILETWSKTGARLRIDKTFSIDTYLDLQFRRSTADYREENFESYGPGLRLNVEAKRLYASLSLHQEDGLYAGGAGTGPLSRWKTLLVLSGDL